MKCLHTGYGLIDTIDAIHISTVMRSFYCSKLATLSTPEMNYVNIPTTPFLGF